MAKRVEMMANMPVVFLPSPSESIELSLNLPQALTKELSIRVYSIDGRLVTHYETEDIQAERTNLLLDGEGEFATGMYTVCIKGLGIGEIIRKVVILND